MLFVDFNSEELQVLDSAWLGEFDGYGHVDLDVTGALYVDKRPWERYQEFFEFFKEHAYIQRIQKEFGVSRSTAQRWVSGDIVLQLILRYAKAEVELDRARAEMEKKLEQGKVFKVRDVPELNRARMKRLNAEGKKIRKLR